MVGWFIGKSVAVARDPREKRREEKKEKENRDKKGEVRLRKGGRDSCSKANREMRDRRSEGLRLFRLRSDPNATDGGAKNVMWHAPHPHKRQ